MGGETAAAAGRLGEKRSKHRSGSHGMAAALLTRKAGHSCHHRSLFAKPGAGCGTALSARSSLTGIPVLVVRPEFCVHNSTALPFLSTPIWVR